jgi:hypothetical protein
VGDRAGVGTACGNLGHCYCSMGQYGLAIELHQECKKIAEEVGDWAMLAGACGNLCTCYTQDGQFVQALPYGKQCYQISREVQLRNEELQSAHDVGTVLRLASLPEEAENWLRIALEGGLSRTHLQLARLMFDTGREQGALFHLKLYLAWCMEGARGECKGCGQVRGEDAPMLKCSGACLYYHCLCLYCARVQMLTCSCLAHSKAAVLRGFAASNAKKWPRLAVRHPYGAHDTRTSAGCSIVRDWLRKDTRALTTIRQICWLSCGRRTYTCFYSTQHFISLSKVEAEGTQGWNDGREAVKRQVNRVFNETRVGE